MKAFLRFFALFYRLQGRAFLTLLFLMILSACAEAIGFGLFIPILEGAEGTTKIGKLFQNIFHSFGWEYSLLRVLMLMVIFFFLKAVLLIASQCYLGKIMAAMIVDLRRKTVQQLLGSHYGYFLKRDIGYLNNAIIVEFESLSFAVKMFVGVVLTLIFATVYLAIPLWLTPALTLGLFVTGIVGMQAVRKIGRLTRETSVKGSAQSAAVQKLLFQIFQHFKYLKATYSQENLLNQFVKAAGDLGKLRYRQMVLSAISDNFFPPFIFFVIAGLLYYQVQYEGKQVMEVLTVLFFLMRSMEKLFQIQTNYRKFLVALGSIQVYEKLEKELAENQEITVTGGAAPDFTQPFIFEKTFFQYGTAREVFHGIECRILPRSTVAFVGASGSGKSTLVTLLTGILRPQAGEVYLGKTPYAALDQKKLRMGLGYVTQEAVIFNDSIKNNLTLWEKNPSPEKVRRALEKAHLWDFVASLPEKEETLLGDNGIHISGGQRQRISIARELYKDPEVLIFDEATSALDSESEAAIQSNIDEFKGQKTIILVAHRLSTIRNSDVIFVLKEGQIVETGDYETLLRKNGEFARMVAFQDMKLGEED